MDEETIVFHLKKFDLDLRLGPCVGMTRLERWTRALSHGKVLNPLHDELCRSLSIIMMHGKEKDRKQFEPCLVSVFDAL
jgi:hypothetical protein